MRDRLEEIETRNKNIIKLIEKSNSIAKELTSDIGELFCVIESNNPQFAFEMASIKTGKRRSTITQISVFEKFKRANRKMKINNLFRTL